MYQPRDASYHANMYGHLYTLQVRPREWADAQLVALLRARGSDVVLPRLRDRGDLREYSEIKRLAVREGRKLIVLRVQRKGFEGYGYPGYMALPDYAVDDTVEVIERDVEASIDRALYAIDLWFGD